MNAWARNRKRLIVAILVLAVGVLIGLPTFFLFRSTPTCADGVMNGDEAGIDCGGSCQKLCQVESLPLIIKGDARILPVATSTYEVVAVVENPNAGALVRHAPYTLTLYGPDSAVPVKTIPGEAYVPKGATFVVFEGPFTADGAAPTRATLTWADPLEWEKNGDHVPELNVSAKPFTRLDSTPRLEATVSNPTLADLATIELTALVSGADGTLFAASKTLVDALPAGATTQAIFTWPARFSQTPIKVDILVRVLPDRSYIK